MSPATNWVRISGDGMVFSGPCVLKLIILHPDVAEDYADIYDGRDAGTGRKFCRIEADVDGMLSINLGDGVRFGGGIFVDGKDSAVETTIAFSLLND